jgi:predicted RNA-binding Zn-ribbon protein involved in translation (DUF1610 family)
MSALKSLTFTTLPKIGADPTLDRHANIIARLEEQKLLPKDSNCTRTVHIWIGWCHETRQPIDLQLYIDDATLARIWSNAVRFRCPHCGVKHETKVERLASRPLSLEPRQTKCMSSPVYGER